jgi:hypothetical protein
LFRYAAVDAAQFRFAATGAPGSVTSVITRIARAAALAVALTALASSGPRLAAAGPRPLLGEVDGDTFRVTLWNWQVTVVAPKNWTLSADRSYPSILLWMIRRDPPGKMLFSAERLNEQIDTPAYAGRAVTLLKTLGFTVRSPQLHAATGAYWVDFESRTASLRQAFVVVGGVGYALTLSAPDTRTRSQHLRAFDATLRALSVRRASAFAPGAELSDRAAGGDDGDAGAPAAPDAGAPPP